MAEQFYAITSHSVAELAPSSSQGEHTYQYATDERSAGPQYYQALPCLDEGAGQRGPTYDFAHSTPNAGASTGAAAYYSTPTPLAPPRASSLPGQPSVYLEPVLGAQEYNVINDFSTHTTPAGSAAMPTGYLDVSPNTNDPAMYELPVPCVDYSSLAETSLNDKVCEECLCGEAVTCLVHFVYTHAHIIAACCSPSIFSSNLPNCWGRGAKISA